MAARHVRDAAPADAEAMLEIYRPIVEQTAISFELEAPSVQELAGRIRAAGERTDPWLVAVIDGTVAGYAYASMFRSRPAYAATRETTVYVSAGHHGLGVGTELMRSLLGRLGEQRVHQAIAGIVLPNAASIALHERLGFRPVGVFPRVGFKFDRWHDLGFWQRQI